MLQQNATNATKVATNATDVQQMKSKVDLKNDLPDLVKQLDDGKISQAWIDNEYDADKSTISRWIKKYRSEESKNVAKNVATNVQQMQQVATNVQQNATPKKPEKPKSQETRKPTQSKDKQSEVDYVDKYRAKKLVEAEERIGLTDIALMSKIYKEMRGLKTYRVTENKLRFMGNGYSNYTDSDEDQIKKKTYRERVFMLTKYAKSIGVLK